MRNVIACAFVLLFAVSMTLSASQHNGLAMSIIEQTGSPAKLTSTTHSTTDYLVSAKLHNSASQRIVDYRIGWVAFLAPGKSTVTIGQVMNVPAGIVPDTTVDVAAQAVNPKSVTEGTRLLGFFVAEVKFADGQSWKANKNDVKRAAERQMQGIANPAR